MNKSGSECTYSQSDPKAESLLLTSDNSSFSSLIELKERTWISVVKIANPSEIVKGKCIVVVSQEIISKIPALVKAMSGADGCAAGTEVCEVSYGISSATGDPSLGITILDKDDYELTVSHDEAIEIAKQFKTTTTGLGIDDGHSAAGAVVLAYNNSFYALYLHTADTKEGIGAQVEAKFVEPSTAAVVVAAYPTPAVLEKDRSLSYTVMLKTWATYGGPAEVDLRATTMADSGLQVRIEPDHLVIPERSEAKAKLVISNYDGRPGNYEIRVAGRINNSSTLFGPCGFDSQCPVIKVGGSGWQIRDYGAGQGMGMAGQWPPETLKVQVVTDKQAYSPGEAVTIEAYLVNDGPERVVLDNGASLVIAIAGDKHKFPNGFVYTIDATYNSDNEPIIVEPGTRLLLARPFQWDQKSFDSSLVPFAVGEEGRYSVSLALSGLQSYVMHDDEEIVIGKEPHPPPSIEESHDSFAGVTITIPQGVYEDDGSGHYFDPDIATIPAMTPFRWENRDFVLHTATSGTPSSDGIGQMFDTGLVAQGQYSQAVMLSEPGKYPYFCQLHPWMTGTVVVVKG